MYTKRMRSYNTSTNSSKSSSPDSANLLLVTEQLLTSSSSSFPPLYLSFNNVFQKKKFVRKMWPIQLAFLFTVCMIFLSSSTRWNTSSFFTRPNHLIFSVLLQYISKFFRYLWHCCEPYCVVLPQVTPRPRSEEGSSLPTGSIVSRRSI